MARPLENFSPGAARFRIALAGSLIAAHLPAVAEQWAPDIVAVLSGANTGIRRIG